MDEVAETTRTGVDALIDQWAAAEQAGDRAALETVLADGFVGVGPAGFVLAREPWLGRFAAGLRNDAFAVEARRLREYGDTVAVVAELAQQTHVGGQDNSGRFRLTLLVVRQAGEWRLAGVHIGLLQSAPAPQAG